MNGESILFRLEQKGHTAPRVALGGSERSVAAASAERYDIVGEIARGAVGIVQRGHDNDLGRDVALKVLREEHLSHSATIQHFVEEAQIGGQLQHPGIVPVYELGLRPDSCPYFAMKLLKGESLAKRLARRAEPAENQRALVSVFREVCRTMSYAHARGVIHCDLEPGNVMIGGYGEVQVVDWGRARVLAVDEVGELHERIDIFSLGAILCEILTGRPCPTDATSLTTQASLTAFYEALAALDATPADPLLTALCRRCLERSPESRPPTAEAVAEEVASWLADAESRAHRAQIRQVGAEADAEEERRVRRQTKLVAGGVVLVVLIAVGMFLLVSLDRAARDRERRAAVEEASEDAARQQAAGAWQPAIAAARRAIELGADEALLVAIEEGARAAEERARILAEDAAFLAELEEIRGRRTRLIITNDRVGLSELRDERETDAAYAAAFERRFGSPEGGVELLKASPSAAAFAANLDVWCWIRKSRLQAADWQEIDRVSRRIDAEDAAVRGALVGDEPGALLAITGQGSEDLAPELAARVGLAIAAKPGKAEVGLAFLLRRIQHSPRDFWSHLHLAEIARGLGQWDIAVRHATAATALRPTHATAWCDLAAALCGRGDRQEAITVLRQVIGFAPEHALSHANLGAVLGVAGDRDEAVAMLRRAIELEPSATPTHTNLGITLENGGALPAAIDAYRRAIELDSESASAHRHLAAALAEAGDVDGATAASKRATELDRERARALGRRAQDLDGQGDAPGAIAELRRAVTLDPDSATLNLNLGAALSNADDAVAAVPFLRRAAELETGDALASTNLGCALSNAGHLDEAVAAFQRALELDPDYVHALENLGITLRRKRDLDGAVAALDRAIGLDGLDPDLHAVRGGMLENRRDPNGAFAAYRRAIELDPENAARHATLGYALGRWGDTKGAVAAYRRALELDPDKLSFWIALGDNLDRQGDVDGAIAAYRRGTEVAPRAASGHTALGGALSNAGRLEEAVRVLRAAIELDFGFVRAHRYLGITLDQKGDREGAILAFRRVIQLEPSSKAAVGDRLTMLERQLRLQPELARVLEGGTVDVTPGDRCVIADMLYREQHFALSAAAYAQAFDDDEWLASSTDPQHRYNAACSASLAGSAWHASALEWLRADLEHRRSQSANYPQWVANTLRHWQQDPDLAPVRDAGDLGAELVQLWADVKAALQQATRRR